MIADNNMARNGRIRVAVDAMGGDYAPQEIVQGAVLAAQKILRNLEVGFG